VKISKSKIILAAFLGVLLYVAVYFMASHGEAFEFAEHAIRNSQSLHSQVGKIESVRIPLFAAYKEKSFNAETWVTMTVEIVGSVKTIELQMRMKKINGDWMIEQASIDGNSVALN
jgi:hypothetical protein